MMSDHNSVLIKRPTSLCLHLFLTSAIFLAGVPVQSQDKKEPRKSGDDDVIKVTSSLVNLDVTVKDKKGKAVTDLKAADFTVTENGVRQNIQFFDSTLAGGNEAKQPNAASKETTPRLPGPSRLPRNIVSLVLDGQTTEATNLKPVRDGIIKYIRERITNNDSVALFAISGGLQLLQPFTQDKESLISAVDKAYGASTVSKTSELRDLNASIASIREKLLTSGSDTVLTAAGGPAAAQAMMTRRILEQYIQLRSALSVQQTRPILAALAAICEGLRPMPGKKTLVMFSQGFVAPQVLDWQVQS